MYDFLLETPSVTRAMPVDGGYYQYWDTPGALLLTHATIERRYLIKQRYAPWLHGRLDSLPADRASRFIRLFLRIKLARN